MVQNNNTKTSLNKLPGIDPIWDNIKEEARDASDADLAITRYMYSLILGNKSLEKVLSLHLSKLLETAHLEERLIEELFDDFYNSHKDIKQIIRSDIAAVFDRDPACHRYIEPVLYFKGFQALQVHRLAHWLWNDGRKDWHIICKVSVHVYFQLIFILQLNLGGVYL